MSEPQKNNLNIEHYHEVSKSPIFNILQKKYYSEGKGGLWVDSWVPMGVCSSVPLADSYARAILAFAEDCKKNGFGPPVIVELGAGAGRLGWLILKRLEELQSYSHDLKYILTDGSEQIVKEWLANPMLQPYFDNGRLFAQKFWVGTDTALNVDRKTLELNAARNTPVIFLANYLFDSLPCNLIRVRDGQLYRDVVRVNNGEDLSGLPVSEDMFPSLKIEYASIPVRGDYSNNKMVNQIVEAYKSSGRNFCVPISPETVRFINAMTAGDAPALLLSGDIGYRYMDQFPSGSPLIFDSYFASYVNFDFIARLFEANGGVMVSDETTNSEFSTCAFMHYGKQASANDNNGVLYSNSLAQAKESMIDNNPAEFEHLRDLAEAADDNVDFTQLMMLIRLSKYDPDTALAVMTPLLRMLQHDSTLVEEHVARTHFERVLENYFPINSNSQLDYMVAQFLLASHQNEAAHDLQAHWIEKLGETPQRCYIFGLSKIRLKDREGGKAQLERAVEIDPEFGPARRALFDQFGPSDQSCTIKGPSAQEFDYTVDLNDPHFHSKAVEKLDANGVLHLKNLYSLELLAEIKSQLLQDHGNLSNDGNGSPHHVGDKRRTIPIKVRGVYSKPEVFANGQLMDVVTEVMGDAPIINGYTSVVTYNGAKNQHIHRDFPPLFPGSDAHFSLPPYGLTMLIPMTDLDEGSGGTRFWPGTHKEYSDPDPNIEHDCVYTKAGDAVIFDMRTIHSGMACLDAKELRLMLCIIYSPAWFRDCDSYNDHDALIIDQSEYDKIPASYEYMFRYASIRDR